MLTKMGRAYFFQAVLLCIAVHCAISEDDNGYKVSHKPGRAKIHANPDSAEFEYSGGDLDVHIRPSPNEFTSILSFYDHQKENHRHQSSHLVGRPIMDDQYGADEASGGGHFFESENHPTILEAAFTSDNEALSSGEVNSKLTYSGDNDDDIDRFIHHSGDNSNFELTGSYRNKILEKTPRRNSHLKTHVKARKGTKKQLWRKPFDFHGSILARFKQHWAEEEKANKEEFDDDYEADRQFEEQRAQRYRHRKHKNADNLGRPTSDELMRNVNAPKQIYPSDEAIHGSGDADYKPNPKQHDEATSRHEFTTQEELQKFEEDKKKKEAEEEQKRKKKKKAKEAKKESKSATDKAYSSIKPIDDDDEGPDDPPESRTKTASRGELRWDEEMPENVSSSIDDETASRSAGNPSESATTTTTPKPTEDAVIQVPPASTVNNDSSSDKKGAENSPSSSEDAYSTIKEKEPAGNLLPPDPNPNPYGMAKPKDPIVSPPTPLSDLPPQNINHHKEAEKEPRSDRMNLGEINSEAELPDQLEHETGRGFRPPANWYNKMPAQDRMNHEFHEQLMDNSIMHSPKHYKDIEPPHQGVEKFGNENEEIDINDKTREGDVDEEEVERRIQNDKNDLPTQDGEEMSKLEDLDNSYNREHRHHHQRDRGMDRDYHEKDEDYPERDYKMDRDEGEREYNRRREKRPGYSNDERDEPFEDIDRDEKLERGKARYSNHRNPEYDEEDDNEDERERNAYEREKEVDKTPYESDRMDYKNSPYSSRHTHHKNRDMEMDQYGDEIRSKQNSEFIQRQNYRPDARYDSGSKPLARHFNYETGEVDDPAGAAEAVASAIENKPSSPYAMFRNKYDDTTDVMKKQRQINQMPLHQPQNDQNTKIPDNTNREVSEYANPGAPDNRSPEIANPGAPDNQSPEIANPRAKQPTTFLQDQYKQMFNKMDTKSSFSVSQQSDNPTRTSHPSLADLEPNKFTSKMQPDSSEKVEPEVKQSNLDGLFKEKVDEAPEIKSAEQAENLMNQMQELAMKNQKLLDSPEAVTSRNQMDLASNDMPPLNLPAQGSTPLVGGKKHTIQHGLHEGYVSKRRRKRHKLLQSNSYKHNATNLISPAGKKDIVNMLDIINKKLETSLKNLSRINNTFNKPSTVTGTRKNDAVVNSTVTININGLNKDKNPCKKSLSKKKLQEKVHTKSPTKKLKKMTHNSNKFHSIGTRKDQAAVNSSVSINITGLNSPNVNYQNFLETKKQHGNKKKLNILPHKVKTNKKLFNNMHQLPTRKDTASVNSSVSINITGLNSPNVNCQNFLPDKQKAHGGKQNRKLCKFNENHNKNSKAHGRTWKHSKDKRRSRKADRRNIIKNLDNHLETIETFYNPHSTRTISKVNAKATNKRKELILNSFFTKSHNIRAPVSRMNQAGKAFASTRGKRSI